jgi:DNA repair exonuclease SbcCD ATPase subunit
MLEAQDDVNQLSTNPYTDQIRIIKKRIELNKGVAEQAKKTVVAKRERCERIRFWIKGFKDIKLYTIEEILQELEITTNAMCEEFGLVGWEVKYDVEKENKSGTISRGLNITVLSPKNKHPVKWEVWSGGEGQRLRIIGTEALSSVLLNHIGVTTNLAMFDEPTIGLSTEGVQDLVEMLAYRAKQADKSIWFIDHHAIPSNKFIQEVTVVRDKEGSYIE